MLRIKNLNYKNILRDINLDISEGELMMIVGVNGGGKTSLLKIISQNKNPNLIIKNNVKISYIKQNSSINSDLKLNVFNFINIHKKYIVNYSNGYYEFVKNVYDGFKINKIEHKMLQSLSGGEMNKLLFYICALLNFDLFVFDEVDSNLDIKSRQMLYEFINVLKNDYKKSFIMSSHEIWVVTRYADKIIHLETTIRCCDSKVSGFKHITNSLQIPEFNLYIHC